MTETENVQQNYTDMLQQALLARKDWLEKEEIGKLKEELRTFQAAFASLYNIYLKKKLIDEDPYKQELKISELEIPDASVVIDAKRIEQLSIRLSNLDSQLDFLVNFYQLSMDFLNLDRVKRIVGLVRYIDWINLTPDNASPMTRAVAELTMSSKQGVDSITLSIIAEGAVRLSKTTATVMNILKDLNAYYREYYKLEVRQKAMQGMSASDATFENIRKKMQPSMQKSPFYKELIDEIIKEDYSSSSPDLQQNVLSSLKIAEKKAKALKPEINLKDILLEGITVIGGASNSLNEIVTKLNDNQTVMENHKKSFIEMLKELIRQITKAEPEEVIYTIIFTDAGTGASSKEKIHYHRFIDDLAKKTKILSSFVRGSAYQKLAAMTEEQIIGYLDKNINDVKALHRVLGAVDDFFKANVAHEDRNKIKGIKPELSALKNSYVKANQLRYEYSAKKEEEEQLKRLGVNPAIAAGAVLNSSNEAGTSSSPPEAASAPAPAAPKPVTPPPAQK